ncbi:hypothetical protein BN7_5622 [Wickerhamomyces ciferrii]|uniref:Uncharacterized protein n=1 Tax=Wickerhamomyces ciferrii (strain ATCC 14091 / BCRC 22168 / CBS 111 / JCM 3599 / NBRC 0793 / NRRL Y-1031 F-60-10) TaxID=1206466 RepID=K0KX16_WICCF|nr:uncharacterized protein BN7_5622 [Wickerhamomyces ciferrii]CCH46034.1 hypothetical protein BN7_5622 [Wickerhamomyces ciferrii]
MGTRKFSNDDIITNMISEIKVEKSLKYTEEEIAKALEEERKQLAQPDEEDLRYIDPQLFHEPKSAVSNVSEGFGLTKLFSIKKAPKKSEGDANEDEEFDNYDLRAAARVPDPDTAVSFTDIFRKSSDSSTQQINDENDKGDDTEIMESGEWSSDDIGSPLNSDYLLLSTFNTPAKLDAIRESDEESEPMFMNSAISIDNINGRSQTPLISFSNLNVSKNPNRNKIDNEEHDLDGDRQKELEDQDEQQVIDAVGTQSQYEYLADPDTTANITAPPLLNIVEDTIDDDTLYQSNGEIGSSKLESNEDFPTTFNQFLDVPEVKVEEEPLFTSDQEFPTQETPSNPFNASRSWKSLLACDTSVPAVSDEVKTKLDIYHEKELESKFEEPTNLILSLQSTNFNPSSSVSKDKRSMASTPRLMNLNKDTLEVISVIESDQSSPISNNPGYKLPNMQHNNIYFNYNQKLDSPDLKEGEILDKSLQLPSYDPKASMNQNVLQKDNINWTSGANSKGPKEEEVKGVEDYNFGNLKSSFNFHSGITSPELDERADDRFIDTSYQNDTPLIAQEPSIKNTETASAFEPFAGTSAVYSGSSLINILANDFDKNFPDSSLNEQTFENFKDKADWIKSLDSAFEIDDNISGELERMVNKVPSLKSHTSSDLQPNSSFSPKSASYSKGMKRAISQYNKKYGFKFTKSTTEKHEEKEIEPPTSPKSITSNGGIGTGFLSKISTRINSVSRPSSAFINDNKKNNLDTEDGPEREIIDVVNPSSEVISNIGISAPGTVTAKLFEDAGIHTKSKDTPKANRHFIEVIKTPSTTDKSSQTLSANFKASTTETDTETSKLSQNYWKTSNRFMDKKNPIGRSRTIRKIFTARSKGSGSLKDASAQNTLDSKVHDSEQSNNVKSSWSNTLFRGKTSRGKRIGSQHLSMDSGVSLDEYAGNFALNQEFEPPSETQVLSTETVDARRIIQMTNTTDATQSDFIDISNGYPVSRDSAFSDTSGSMASSIHERLRTTKAVEDYTPTPIPGRQRSLSVLYRTRNLRFASLKRNRSLNNVDSIRDQTISFANDKRKNHNVNNTENKSIQNINDAANKENLNKDKQKLKRGNSRLGGFLFPKNNANYQGENQSNVNLPYKNHEVHEVQNETLGTLKRRGTLLKRFKSVYKK